MTGVRGLARQSLVAFTAVVSFVVAFVGVMYADDGAESLNAVATTAALVAGVGWVAGFAWLKLKGIRRHDPWACEHCGYDLRYNVSGRCPECGVASEVP